MSGLFPSYLDEESALACPEAVVSAGYGTRVIKQVEWEAGTNKLNEW